MGGIARIDKLVGSNRAAQVIAAPRGDVQGAEDFFILNVASGWRQFLRPKAQLAQFTRGRFLFELVVVRVDHAPGAAEQRRFLDSAIGYLHRADRAIFITHWKTSFASRRHVINLSRRQIVYVRRRPPRQAMAFLGLLLV